MSIGEIINIARDNFSDRVSIYDLDSYKKGSRKHDVSQAMVFAKTLSRVHEYISPR